MTTTRLSLPPVARIQLLTSMVTRKPLVASVRHPTQLLLSQLHNVRGLCPCHPSNFGPCRFPKVPFSKARLSTSPFPIWKDHAGARIGNGSTPTGPTSGT